MYALPSPQQSATLVFYGSNAFNGDDDGIATQFLVPIGTASGDAETTFDFVEVDTTVIETVSGTVNVTQTATSTITCTF